MITLYKFGPFLGTPDSSPFVIKVMLLLRLAEAPFREAQGNPFRSPHGLLPYIEDDGIKVADSTLIRFHLEQKYRVDFDRGLSAEQKATAWAVERMCEDHLYFAMLDLRWMNRANFNKGLGRHMFGSVPALVRPLVRALLSRMNAKRLRGHGIGRLPRARNEELAIRDVAALAALLGDKPFLMGEEPCGADAIVFGMVTSILTPPLDSAVRDAMQKRANLVSYRDRVTKAYFTELPVVRGAPVETVSARRVVSGT